MNLALLLPSILSGILAALAGGCGKYAFQPFQSETYNYDEIAYKAVAGAGMLILNSLMIKYFLQSMKELGAGKASVINFTCNYLSSVSVMQAIVGVLFYGEVVSLQWMMGAGLMLIGVNILVS